MRILLTSSVLFALLFAAPARALLTDDEPANNAIATAGTQLTRLNGPVADAGFFSLFEGDVDFVGIAALVVGDVITAVTTPLEDEFLEMPDTVLGLFDAQGQLLAFNDDAANDDDGDGFGSLIRYRVLEDGDYYVGVSGALDLDFEGDHSEDGRYALSLSVAPIPEPSTIVLLGAGIAVKLARAADAAAPTCR